MQDGFDKQNAEMNLDIRKQKKKLKKLLDKVKLSFTNRPNQACFTQYSYLYIFLLPALVYVILSQSHVVTLQFSW
jgi:hypothetical protein